MFGWNSSRDVEDVSGDARSREVSVTSQDRDVLKYVSRPRLHPWYYGMVNKIWKFLHFQLSHFTHNSEMNLFAFSAYCPFVNPALPHFSRNQNKITGKLLLCMFTEDTSLWLHFMLFMLPMKYRAGMPSLAWDSHDRFICTFPPPWKMCCTFFLLLFNIVPSDFITNYFTWVKKL